jgi:hypothetical protein
MSVSKRRFYRQSRTSPKASPKRSPTRRRTSLKASPRASPKRSPTRRESSRRVLPKRSSTRRKSSRRVSPKRTNQHRHSRTKALHAIIKNILKNPKFNQHAHDTIVKKVPAYAQIAKITLDIMGDVNMKAAYMHAFKHPKVFPLIKSEDQKLKQVVVKHLESQKGAVTKDAIIDGLVNYYKMPETLPNTQKILEYVKSKMPSAAPSSLPSTSDATSETEGSSIELANEALKKFSSPEFMNKAQTAILEQVPNFAKIIDLQDAVRKNPSNFVNTIRDFAQTQSDALAQTLEKVIEKGVVDDDSLIAGLVAYWKQAPIDELHAKLTRST